MVMQKFAVADSDTTSAHIFSVIKKYVLINTTQSTKTGASSANSVVCIF